MDVVDLGSAAERMANLIRGVREDQLGEPTPCPAYSLGDLLDHVGGLTLRLYCGRQEGRARYRLPRAIGRRVAARERLANRDPARSRHSRRGMA